MRLHARHLAVFVGLLLLSAVATQRAAAQNWPNGYYYQQTITINYNEVPNTDQTNFPVLISGTYPNLATIAYGGGVSSSNGYDIIFTSDANGENILPFERESYSATTGAIIYWVQVPTVSHTSNTVIYMFYGNPNVTTDQSNKNGAWDSNYKGVWHLPNGTTLSANDSTSNANNGTVSGASAATGYIDGGASLNGSNTWIDMGASVSSLQPSSSLTVEIWVRPTSSSQTEYAGIIVQDYSNPRNTPYCSYKLNMNFGDDGHYGFEMSTNGTDENVDSGQAYSNGTWALIVGTYDGTTQKVYVNGSLAGSVSRSGNFSYSNGRFRIGANSANGEIPSAIVDEARISSIARSADWIATEYNNESSPSTFYSVSSPQTSGSAPGIMSLSPSSGPAGLPVVITGSNFGSTQGSSAVTFDGVTTNPTGWSATSIIAPVPAGAASGNVVATVGGVASNGVNFNVTSTSSPVISYITPTSGPPGTPVTIAGINFGSSQGSSTVSLNGTAATVISWNNSSIVALVPSGATSGAFSVTVGGQNATSNTFFVTKLPSGWLDQDIGGVQGAGSATFSNGTFTVNGSGNTLNTSGDAFNFAYQQLAGNGSIIAQVASVSTSYAQVGIMIRETLTAGSREAELMTYGGGYYYVYRSNTGSNSSYVNASGPVPYWVEITRSGSTFTAYMSQDGVNWSQVGSSQTINMAQNVYIGMAVSSDNEYGPYTGTFNGVSISSATNAGPQITDVSATTGSAGSQVVITGTGFGNTEGLVTLAGTPMTINSWSSTSITITIAAGAASGYLIVSVPPNMDDSNPIDFTITSNPLPSSWLDTDIGNVSDGTASYTNGQFTVKGSGNINNVSADGLHFVYQQLSGDGTIIARVVSVSYPYSQAGVMIRESLDSTAKSMAVVDNIGYISNIFRTIDGATDSTVQGSSENLPYWVKLVRTGNSFIGYSSPDGVSWSIVGGPVYIEMAQNAYIGLVMTSDGSSSVYTAVFDNVSVTTTSTAAPQITSVSATTGPVGSQVTIYGNGFGASQGSSLALLSDSPATIDSWSATSITITIPTGATSGFLAVLLGPSMVSSNAIYFTVTSEPLPSGWLDQDVGAVGKTGSASFSGGTFTVQGAGTSVSGSADGFHFVYQELTSDGSIVAEVASENTYTQAGVMIRESLDASSAETLSYLWTNGTSSSSYMNYRTVDGGLVQQANGLSVAAPYWVMVSRTANAFSAYVSSDGQNWVQTGSTVTYTTGDTVYVGLVVSSGSTSTLASATFSNVSVNLGSSLPTPVITGLSTTTGPPGTSVTINGSGFGATQGSSTAYFNGAAATVITSWSDSQITAVVPESATTGPVSVTVGNITVQGPTFTVAFAVTLTDSLGNQTTYSSSLSGGQWSITNAQGSGCSTCTIRGNIQNQYDANGNLLWTVDPNGNSTVNAYDSYGDLTTQFKPLNASAAATTTYTYNGFGEVLTMTDPLGNVTTNAYDSHGNLTSITTPKPNSNTGASVTQFAYNSLGELTQITDPLSRVTTLTYTSAGQIASITDPQSNVTSYGYDSRGNRMSITDPMNHQTTFALDAGNRLTQITYPDNSTMTFGYDYRGRRTSMTDQNGKTTTYAYDDEDRLTSVTDANSNVTQYGYDTESNLISITDANSHTTNFAYDAYGRVTQTTFPSNAFETYGYDADSNLTSKTDRKGQTIQYVYDALNRLTQKSYQDGTSVEYTYDLVGKILQANDPTGTYGFSYDNMGRLIGTSTVYSFLPNSTFTNAYSYDANSNRTGYTAPDNSTNSYTYDTLNRLTNLTSSWSGSFGFSYDSLSRRTQMTRPNNVATNYTYDNLSRLLSVLHQLSGSTIDGAVYTLDADGNRSTKQDDLAGVTTSYGYDNIYELLSATQGGTTTESYTYDPVGNRTASLAIPSYTVNTSNELTGDSSASYTYDNNGNTLTKVVGSNTTSYAWDFENRLTSVTLPGTGGTVQFKYDPFGRRIEKISPTATSIFVYDGDDLVETVNASGGEVASYAQGDIIDEPLAMDRSGTIDYYEQDGLGSVTSLTASNGSLAQSYTYDSFGNQTASSGSLTNFFRYTGREFDTETGLYYYRARYYDSMPGRFLSEDPLAFDGDGTDFYLYVLNNPNVFIDPLGLWHCASDADCNFTPAFKRGLDRFQQCIGKTEVIITSGRRPPTPSRPNTNHTRGEACDIGRNSNPNLTRDKVVGCFLQAFPNSYGQEEKNGGGTPGTHFHFQLTPLPGTPPGFPPGVRPYQP